jgi:hypothetical protein
MKCVFPLPARSMLLYFQTVSAITSASEDRIETLQFSGATLNFHTVAFRRIGTERCLLI